MKNCLKCGAEVAADNKFCGYCGLSTDSNEIAYTNSLESREKSSFWLKIIATVLTFLAAVYIYTNFANSKDRECWAKARLNRMTIYQVSDANWSFGVCKYLVISKTIDGIESTDQPEWRKKMKFSLNFS